MIQRIFRLISMGVIAWIVTPVLVFGASELKQDAEDARILTVHLQEVFDAKVSLTPFEGLKAINPIAEVPNVKADERAVIKIPAENLPGEFVLRLDYRAKETDQPYPSERIIYINNRDIEIFVNPPYINNNEKTKFNADETENTVYSVFMKENSPKRAPIDLLRQFLLNYDRPESEFYTEAIKEFEERRLEYNAWLSGEAKKYHDLYVSILFQFQYVPAAVWGGKEEERVNSLIQNYFDGLDLNNPLITRSRELSMFMNGYMNLYGMQAKSEEAHDSFFTEAGRTACEKAAKGDPKVYGWMVDYFYAGYESYNIAKGMEMLKEHIDNPNCLTSKKEQIIKRLEGAKKLVAGTLAPNFIIKDKDDESREFEFHKWKGKAQYKLLLFWTNDCVSCNDLVKAISEWHNIPANKEKLDIAAISLNETEAMEGKWKTAIADIPEWTHLHLKEGVNSLVARDYAVLSTPVMFLIESENNIIKSVPENLSQLIKDLGGDEKGAELYQKSEPAAKPIVNAEINDAASLPAPLFIYEETIKKIEAVFFSKVSCKACSRVHGELVRLQTQYPRFSFKEFDINDPETVLFYEYLGEKLNIPKDKILLVPAVVIGDVFLSSSDETAYSNIEQYITKHGSRKEILSPYNAFLSEVKEKDKKVLLENRIVNTFMDFKALPVFAAGLVDGINPCAFGAIVFFVTCLWAVKKRKDYVLAAGTVFITAVFLAYFSIGIGAVKTLNFLFFMPIFKKVTSFIYITASIFLFVLAYLSLIDFIHHVRGKKSRKMLLQLSEAKKAKIRSVISKHLRLPRIIVGVSLAAFLVSVTELACTGQVYLPAILYILKVDELRQRAMLFLLLYNAAFIIPLIVVFVLSFFGFNSYKLADLARKNARVGKLLLFLFFFGLGIIFIFMR